MIGTISRWGTRGYGFVTCDGLAAEAWLHAKFLDDPDYEPRQGDRVEFELEKLADGRYQARRVRPANGVRSRPQGGRSGGPGGDLASAYGDGPLAVKLSLPPLPHLPSLQPDPRAAPGARPATLASLGALPALASLAPERAVERAADLAEAAPSLVPPTPAQADDLLLGHRLAAGREEREAALSRLRAESTALASELARLEERRREVEARLEAGQRAADSDEAATVTSYLAAAAARLKQAFGERRRMREALELARQHALQRSGLPTVQEYEELRDRMREAAAGGDALTLKAFRALERERRLTLRDLADAHDRLEAAAPVRARFVAFLEPGRTVLVAPLPAEELAAAGVGAAAGLPADVVLRIACSFWQAAERACRELAGADLNVEHGAVAGALAVRIGPVDPGLVQLLLDETWAARPTLGRLQIEHAFEVVEGLGPPFQPEEAGAIEDEPPPAAPPGSGPGGGGLPEVAVRLGLSLRDLVALLGDRGLPFVDDLVDQGTEHTLRALLGEARTDSAPAAAAPLPEDEDDAGAPPGARGVASRMLRKLLRDRRVGGRHTRIENAYGHHFSDGEKDIARRIAGWLEKDGILLPKLNEGSHHISINPRRLRDVGSIIDGSWERAADLDAV